MLKLSYYASTKFGRLVKPPGLPNIILLYTLSLTLTRIYKHLGQIMLSARYCGGSVNNPPCQKLGAQEKLEFDPELGRSLDKIIYGILWNPRIKSCRMQSTRSGKRLDRTGELVIYEHGGRPLITDVTVESRILVSTYFISGF